jgi:hypothetical protein
MAEEREQSHRHRTRPDHPDRPDRPDHPGRPDRPDRDDQWVFPAPLPGQPDEDEEEAPDSLVELCTIPVAEAESTCARLESEGIPCHIEEDGADETSPTDAGSVTVQVREEDLERAQAVLAGEVEEPDEDERELQRAREERLAANWICPKCRDHTLEILPLPEAWRKVRRVAVVMLFGPLLLMALAWAIPISLFMAANDFLSGWQPWLLVVSVSLLWAASLVRREKQCTDCGWCSRRENP